MFKVERYGDDKKPAPPAPAPVLAKSHAPSPRSGKPGLVRADSGAPKIDWRELKQRKKRWAVELERERDQLGGASAPAEAERKPEAADASRAPLPKEKKRSRGGSKLKAKKARLDAGPEQADAERDGTVADDSVDAMEESVGAEPVQELTEDIPAAEEINENDEVESKDPNAFLFAGTASIKKPNLKAQGLPEWLANPTRIPSTLSTKTPESSIANPAYNLSKHTQARLKALDIDHLFPVQQAVLPKLLLSRYSSSPRTPPGDLLVSSATGSGKTLAYVLPILEYLISNPVLASTATTARVIPRLRALIVVPTRDLAVQVKTTLEQVSKGSTIRIGVVTGSMSFHAEQETLVETGGRDIGTEGILNDGRRRCCKVDVLVATPGRLTDHLKGTPGFSLRHLRFLVLDEADRLLIQDYQGWLSMVLKGVKEDLINSDGVALVDDEDGFAAHSKSRYDRYLASGCCAALSTSVDSTKANSTGQEWQRLGFKVDELGMPLHNVVSLRHDQVQQLEDGNVQNKNGTYTIRHHTPLQKLLFSATLTRNPEKIASLQLTNPSYIAVSTSTSVRQTVTTNVDGEEQQFELQQEEDEDLSIEKYNAPPTLTEHMIVVETTSSKPLVLLHLLFNLNLSGLLIFTRSVESAHRLASLIESVNEIMCTGGNKVVTSRAISSDLSTGDRKRLITSFSKGEITALVCSDVMARGMDLGQSVKGVVNYDVPTSGGGVKTYVHRVGRTARAGREGDAWSIVEEKEARWFKKDVVGLVTRSEGKTVSRMRVSENETAGRLKLAYERALEKLSLLVKGK